MEKLALAQKALASLGAILKEPDSEIVRDATIQRFEYTSEAVWKAAAAWLMEHESLEERHPRGTYRALFRIGCINESLALALQQVVVDRNKTSHAYMESVAKAVYEAIPQHYQSLSAVINVIQNESRS